MLLHDARRDARIDEAGDLVILEEQDRRRWDQRQIAEALPLVEEALRGGPGPFRTAGGDCGGALSGGACRGYRLACRFVRLYDLLERLQPSPIVSLNRAVAVAMVEGPQPASRWWMPSPPATISTTITCCTPSAPICCAALDPLRKRRKATSARSRLSPMTASGGFWSGACAKFSHRQREPESRLPTRAAAPPSGQPAWRATPRSTPALPTPETSGTPPRDGCT